MRISRNLCIFAKWDRSEVMSQPKRYAESPAYFAIFRLIKFRYIMANKMTKDDFIRRAKQVHGEKYDYSKVVYNGSKKKVEIVCPVHGSFFQAPAMHLTGRGCKKCATDKIRLDTAKATEKFICDAQNVHGDYYSYNKTVYTGSRNKVVITCPIHGDFEQLAQTHLVGHGCRLCANEKNKKTTEQFVTEAKQVHKDKYLYDKCNYIHCTQKVCITCPKHGDFWQLPTPHLAGAGCPFCAIESFPKDRTTPLKQVLEKFKDVHGDTYDYSLINEKTYINLRTPVPIICKEHGVFYQKPNNHSIGMGCPMCKKSLGENRIKNFLDKNSIQYIQQYKIFTDDLFCENKKVFVDFFLREKNIIIEYNGLQHYKEVEYFGGEKTFKRQIARDIFVKSYCKEHKIKLVEIPYWDFDNIETILKKELKLK